MNDYFVKKSKKTQKIKIGLICAGVVLLIAVAIVACVMLKGKLKDTDKKKTNSNSTEKINNQKDNISEEDMKQDPQAQMIANDQEGAKTDISQVLKANNETNGISNGIDVSKYQGNIDWQTVAEQGIDFAIIRIGYRTQVDGRIVEDECAKYNLQEASKYGIKLGAYFFSAAVNTSEAEEEANFVTNIIEKYAITYPVAYNCEGFREESSRQANMSVSERTNVAMAFLDTIQSHGYKGMFYASKSEMDDEQLWDMKTIANKYKVWVSQYPSEGYPAKEKSDYSGNTDVWQYTNYGKISGIKTSVDLNVAYFSFSSNTSAKNEENNETVTSNPDVGANFKDVSETVTPKDTVNLRSSMDQGDNSNVVGTVKNGETLTRTGISANGWSKLIYNNQTVYAISSYLTTDLNAKKTEGTTGSQFATQFQSVSVNVTAKEITNLRNMPSVTDPSSQIVYELKAGEVVLETGVSDNGWARVEYNGQTLYAVSSYLVQSAQ